MKSHQFDNTFVSIAAVFVGLATAAAFKLAFSHEEDPEPDATDELLRDPRNAERLLGAVASLRRGEWESHPLATRPPVAA